ncbi:MAG: EpsD family peptidyl-prolyl cis-trans isomerase [Sulfuriferula sp.]
MNDACYPFKFLSWHKMVRRFTCHAILCSTVLLLAGCGHKADQGKTQVMAKVDGKEITVPEVNQYLSQQIYYNGSRKQIRRKAIDAVINQHLLIDAAKKDKLDRSPDVMQALLLSQKQTLIKAYLAQKFAVVSAPTAAEISAFYQANPVLFGNRVLYVINQVHILADAPLQHQLLNQLEASKTTADFMNELNQNAIPYDRREIIKAPESMSEYELEAMSKMPLDGTLVLNQTEKGLDLLILVSTIPEPIALNRAQLQITELLITQEKAKAIDNLLQRLRQQAKIQYLD